MPDQADVDRWLAAIQLRPELYRLPAYGSHVPPARAAQLFAQWEADELSDKPVPALCRRCGKLLRAADIFRPHQQTHIHCDAPRPQPLPPVGQ